MFKRDVDKILTSCFMLFEEKARERDRYTISHIRRKTHVNTDKRRIDDDRKGVVVIIRGIDEYCCWLLHVYDCVFSLPRRGRGRGGSVGG